MIHQQHVMHFHPAQAAPFEKFQILFLSSIEWDAAWQRHQIFASQFAEAGHEVFFLENTGFRNPTVRDLPRMLRRLGRLFASAPPKVSGRVPTGMRVVSPVVLPPTFRAFRRLNSSLFLPKLARRLERLGLRAHPVIIVSMPSASTLDLIRKLSPTAVVYDCASNLSAHANAPKDFAALESELLRVANLVVADSDFLRDRLKPMHPNVEQIHQGVSEEFFNAAPASGDWRKFCYYGTWVPDLGIEFLTALADAGFDVTVSGFVKDSSSQFPASIRRLGPVPREELLKRLETFDVFLLPHHITPFHLGVIPAKLYECMAMGRPIIATPLPSLNAFSELVYIAETPEQWAQIARDLPKTETPAKREARIRLGRQHTHAHEFGRLYDRVRNSFQANTFQANS